MLEVRTNLVLCELMLSSFLKRNVFKWGWHSNMSCTLIVILDSQSTESSNDCPCLYNAIVFQTPTYYATINIKPHYPPPGRM